MEQPNILTSLLEAIKEGNVEVRQIGRNVIPFPLHDEADIEDNPIMAYSFIPLADEVKKRQAANPIIAGDIVRTEKGDYCKIGD